MVWELHNLIYESLFLCSFGSEKKTGSKLYFAFIIHVTSEKIVNIVVCILHWYIIHCQVKNMTTKKGYTSGLFCPQIWNMVVVLWVYTYSKCLHSSLLPLPLKSPTFACSNMYSTEITPNKLIKSLCLAQCKCFPGQPSFSISWIKGKCWEPLCPTLILSISQT